MAWWEKRGENERAWKVSAEQIAANGYNLDLKNPNAKKELEHLPPEQLADDLLQKELRLTEIMREIRDLLGGKS